jgi:hypothetical protein
LQELFERYGRIECVKIYDGFAFVDFYDREDGAEAIRRVDGKELHGSRFVLGRQRFDREGINIGHEASIFLIPSILWLSKLFWRFSREVSCFGTDLLWSGPSETPEGDTAKMTTILEEENANEIVTDTTAEAHEEAEVSVAAEAEAEAEAATVVRESVHPHL